MSSISRSHPQGITRIQRQEHLRTLPSLVTGWGRVTPAPSKLAPSPAAERDLVELDGQLSVPVVGEVSDLVPGDERSIRSGDAEALGER